MPVINASIQNGKYEDVLAAVQSPIITLTELVKNASDSSCNKEDPIVVNIDSVNRIIWIMDSGEGFCKYELDHLGEAGYSTKMIGGKTRSPIDNPLSGSKGLGLLTAFFIADILEIETYSRLDNKSYYLIWRKGDQKYTYEEKETGFIGTKITLRNIDVYKMQMILLTEEKKKLFMSSLRFFTHELNLPKIKLIIDGQEETHYPEETLEDFYYKNRRDDKGFVAKASFRYENNKIFLSYVDNAYNFYNFSDKVIDLTDVRSVDKFINDIRSPEKVAPIKAICSSEVFTEKYWPINLPEFSGVLYTWRGSKIEKLIQWPVGVRIYVNNYSLYKYLDKENDWLTLSEISQNLKATNYKLKNTFGYINITDYNENDEDLKISKERNDFVDSIFHRKFIYIMREVVAEVFARIDIAGKNAPVPSFSLRSNNITVRVGQNVDLANTINCKNMGLEDISIQYDESNLTINEDWKISANRAGTYEIKLTYENICHTITINYKNTIPEFELSKQAITIFRGNTLNLRDYILPLSCKDVTPESIEILPDDSNTIIRNDLFDKNNTIGQHVIIYRYNEFQRTLVITIKDIERLPGSGARSPRIDILFPKVGKLRENSFKIPELVDAISSYYVQIPTLCMAAIRILIESSTKAFFQSLVDEEIDGSINSLVNRVINLRNCDPKSQDYQKYILSHNDQFIMKFQSISDLYKTSLSKDAKTNINTHLNEIDLNIFVHNPLIVSTDTTVYKSMQIFSPLLNYIFDILLLCKGIYDN